MRSRVVLMFLLLMLATSGVQAQFRLYESGMKAYKSQDWDTAITQLTDFLSKWQHDKAHDDEINYALGVCYFKKGDYVSAMKMLDATDRINPDFQKGSVSWLLAVSCDRLNQPKEAIVEYGHAIMAYQNDSKNRSKLLTERSKIQTRIGDAVAAKDDLTQALIFDPNNAEAKSILDKMNEVVMVSNREAKTQIKETKPGDKTADHKKGKKTEPKKKPDVVADVVPEQPAAQTTQTTIIQQQSTPPAVQPTPQQVVADAVQKIPTLADMYADERRYALVIGNSSYPPSMGLLPNPKNDAADIAEALKKEGFSVNLLIDATYGEMKKGIFDLKKTLDQSVRDKTVALFYYAGHGIQAMSENWLIPVDSKLVIKDEDDIRVQCVPVQALVLNNLLYTNSRMNIIILDACRNNPIPSTSRSTGGKGLQEVSRARGSWIAFATAPGSVASDGQGRNGLYTQELLKAMSKPGLSIEEVFKEVRKNVYAQSGERQETWDNSNIIGDFYFNLRPK